MKKLNNFISVKNLFFIYIIVYCFVAIFRPAATSVQYISNVLHNDDIVIGYLVVVLVFAILGLFYANTPLKMWGYLSPYLGYAFMSMYTIPQSTNPPYTVIVNFMFFFLLAIVITWKQVNG